MACHYEPKPRDESDMPDANPDCMALVKSESSSPSDWESSQRHLFSAYTLPDYEGCPDGDKLRKHRIERDQLANFAVFSDPNIWSLSYDRYTVPRHLVPTGWAVVEAAAYSQ